MKTKIIICVAAAAMFLGLGAAPAREAQYESYSKAFDAGIAFKGAGEFNQALQAFNRAEELTPDADRKMQACFLAGTALRDLGRWQHLLEACSSALENGEALDYSGPYEPKIKLLYAMALKNTGQKDEAAECLREIIKDSNDTDAKTDLALLLFNGDKKDEAERLLKEVVKEKIEPYQLCLASHYLGIINQEKGNYREAIPYFETVLKNNGSTKFMAMTRGASCCMASDHLPKALAFLGDSAQVKNISQAQQNEVDAVVETIFSRLINESDSGRLKNEGLPPSTAEFIKSKLRNKFDSNARAISELKKEFPGSRELVPLAKEHDACGQDLEQACSAKNTDIAGMVNAWGKIEALCTKTMMAKKALYQNQDILDEGSP